MSSALDRLLRPLAADDWENVREIYLAGIATGRATFQTSAPTREEWERAHFPHPRIAACIGEQVAGWAALSPVSTRAAYRGDAEVSVYVSPGFQRLGAGRDLLLALIRESEASGIWTLQAAILAENVQSAALHERCGFRLVGRRDRPGQPHDVWRDLLLYERRSSVVGC
jgi:L-amino acid N-acyltransferase YncA